MKYLLSIIVALLVVSTMVQSQTSYQIEYPYNRTVQVVRDTLSSLYTTARSYNWINLPKATNIAVLASAQGVNVANKDTIVITYVLKNSTTGALSASATLGSFILTAGITAQETLITVIPDTTFIGYDQVRFGFTLTKLDESNGDNYTVRLFTVANARANGNFGLGGVSPEFNKMQEVYYKTGYSSSTANDTTQWISFVGADRMVLFARATDSAVARVYYRLRNKTVGQSTAGTSDPVITSWAWIFTATNVQTSDTTYRLGTILPSTLMGYEQIQFYVDYQANSTAESGRVFRLYNYFFRRD